jgi:hypothetical protein
MTILTMVITLIVCGAGLGWLFYDLNKTIENYELQEAERCESSEGEN